MISNKENSQTIYLSQDILVYKTNNTNGKTLCVKKYLNHDKKLFRELANNEIYINEKLKRSRYVTRYYGNTGYELLFEYSSIGNLYDYKLRTGKLENDLLRRIILDIVLGLKAIHKEGIIHNDLKMSNILLFSDKKGRIFPKLSDFNVSYEMLVPMESKECEELSFKINCDLDRRTSYLFPVSGYNVDRSTLPTFASDYFALGVMIYELIIGELPFKCINIFKAVENKTYRENEDFKTYPNRMFKDLIENLITIEKHRLNDSTILKHPFFCE
jgi:serine/threonine protein kinase